MKIAYKDVAFRKASLKMIDRANEVIEDYQSQDLVLTLRQLYYQFVSRDWIPNKVESYKQLGTIVNDARLSGLIDWDAIEDRTRNLESNSHWTSPSGIIESCIEQYQIDKWEGQKYQPEVWIEKEALAGVIERICKSLDVPFFACRGYTSQSEMWRAGERLRGYSTNGRSPVIIHLGDHDPSGIDMTRDIRDRLSLFMGDESVNLEVKRIALNYSQVKEFKPPPNPAKATDSRFADYQSLYGDESWELDALDPATLVSLVSDAVSDYRDQKTWNKAVRVEDSHKQQLLSLAKDLR